MTFDHGGVSSALQFGDSESSKPAIHALRSDGLDLAVKDVSSITTTLVVLLPSKDNGRRVNEPRAYKRVKYDADLRTEQSSRDTCSDDLVIWSPSGSERAKGNLAPLTSRVFSHSSSTRASGKAQTPNSLSTSTEANTSLLYSCPVCHLGFRTPGLRRYVILGDRPCLSFACCTNHIFFQKSPES